MNAVWAQAQTQIVFYCCVGIVFFSPFALLKNVLAHSLNILLTFRCLYLIYYSFATTNRTAIDKRPKPSSFDNQQKNKDGERKRETKRKNVLHVKMEISNCLEFCALFLIHFLLLLYLFYTEHRMKNAPFAGWLFSSNFQSRWILSVYKMSKE